MRVGIEEFLILQLTPVAATKYRGMYIHSSVCGKGKTLGLTSSRVMVCAKGSNVAS